MMLTARLELGGRCGLRVVPGLFRHHQLAQLGVGWQYAVVRAAGSAHSGCLKSASLGIAPCTVSTFCPARGPKAMR